MLMTKTDLRQFKAVQHRLEDKQGLQWLRIRTAAAPTPALIHGGPVFISVGQVVQLDVVGEDLSRRLADEDSTVALPDPAPVEEASVDPQAAVEVTAAAAQEPITATATAEPTTATAATTQQPPATATSTKISGGMNLGQHDFAPLQTHSTPVKVGTPGDRYLFTESPVEYYYYH
jgi:hypothetical protein